MSVPKKRRTKSAVRNRRSHHSLGVIYLNKCPKCGKAVKAHIACSFCGTYKKQEIKIKKIKKS